MTAHHSFPSLQIHQKSPNTIRPHTATISNNLQATQVPHQAHTNRHNNQATQTLHPHHHTSNQLHHNNQATPCQLQFINQSQAIVQLHHHPTHLNQALMRLNQLQATNHNQLLTSNHNHHTLTLVNQVSTTTLPIMLPQIKLIMVQEHHH